MKQVKKSSYFNPETLKFEDVGRNIHRTLRRVAFFMLFSFIIAAIYYSVYSLFSDTFSEYSIKRENKILAEHIAEINDRYKKLNDVILDIAKRDTNIYSVIFETKPLDIFANAESSSERYEYFRTKTNKELILLANDKLQTLTDKIRKQSTIVDSLKNMIEEKRDELKFIPAIIPINNLHINAVGASIGDKINPIHKSLHVHKGIDFAAPVGSDVIATASGTVRDVISKKFSSGTEIIIDHENGYETRYLYLAETFVHRGMQVERGNIIGKVGNIGVTVPHLHYEVRMGGKIADPLNYFFMELSPQETILFARASLDKGQSLD
ncbi:MAG: M23 family metallopeptidase [Prevotellaceae bacterium]|jgi:murein DD-endopeptidase MepM/ murein hydrolase activator NlpD|nr:M23 family metallopeptidase [Prevotellaceae bacterium]